MSIRSIRRTATLAAGALAISAGVVGLGGSPASADDPVIIFYTQCDEMSTTATVKVKRINADGKNAVTIGDTGIAHCAALTDPIPDYFHSGFAVSGEYGYVAWQKSSGADAGIARIRLDGSAAVERNFIDFPDTVTRLQMSPRPVDGHLYLYADSGQIDPNNPMVYGRKDPRIVSVKVSDKTIATVYTPTSNDPDIPVRTMSFGVGKDALYYSTDATRGKDLERVTFAGSRTGVVFSFTTADSGMQFLNGTGATLVAESSDTFFFYAQEEASPYRTGISQTGSAAPNSGFERFGAVPGVETVGDENGPQFQVWGETHLYYKNGTGKQISRTTKNGDIEDNVFPDIVTKGFIHHISPAKASTVTVTTTTTSTSSTTSTTVAANTTSSAPAGSSSLTTVAASTTTTVAQPTVPTKGGLAGKALATYLKMSVPKGAKIGLKVAPASKKVCTVKSGKLLALKSGNCRVTATVTPKKGKSTKRSTTLKV